jgi:DNA end-binding protein Ku
MESSQAIEIERFVRLEEVDPIYFDRTYFLTPGDAAAARRPYVLLLEAMKETEMAAVGHFVRQGAEHFCLLRPKGNALVLETVVLAEDVRSEAEIEEAVEEVDVKDSELELARQVINSLAGDFEPEELTSEYRSQLRAMLEAKLAGEEIKVPEPTAEEPKVVDLMEALKASVAEAKGQKKAPKKAKAAPKSGSRRRREPARKSA